MDAKSGQTFGIISVVLAAVTFGIQIMGGLCCGWIGWPLGIAAVICGLIAITKGATTLGLIGIGLSVVGVILQIAGVGAGVASLSSMNR